MAGSNLPTGNEPPKGYEKIFEELGRERAEVTVSRVSATQLTSLEIRELESIRRSAIERIREAVGNRGFEITFDREMNLWPDGKTPSDKLLFRAYSSEGGIMGYALVVRGWPSPREWTIQHLIIDPEYRLRGVGHAVIRAIEVDAAKAESIDAVVAVPISKDNDNFWVVQGYAESGKQKVLLENGLEFNPDVYRKAIG